MESSFNVLDMWGHMGGLDKFIVVTLAGMSMYSIWVMIDRFLSYRKAKLTNGIFLRELGERLNDGDLEGAIIAANQQSQSPNARVVEGVLNEYRLGEESLTASQGEELDLDVVDAINREIARVKEQEVSNLKEGLGGLATISSAAPFIGLFGTVIGIINAFRSMASSGQGGLGAVSAGISEALFTTATGLIVAIPAMMAFNYFTNRTEEFVIGMNDIATQLLNHLLRSAKAQKRAA